jgi:hypothetical protein
MARTLARLMIETTLRATSEKLWPGLSSTFGGPLIRPANVVAKKFSIAARPSGVARLPWATTRPLWLIESTLLESSKWLRRPASHSSRISIRKCGFGSHFGSAGSKPEGPLSMA